MKTIVSLALAGFMSISALLPALAAQEAESVSIAESSSISESMAQDESSVSSSGSTADESTAPESGSNAGADVSQPESDSMSVESDSSISEDSETENGGKLPVTVSEEYAVLLATNQADSMMGHAGMKRSDACTQPAASFVLADYAAETEDESYCLLWEAMNAEFEQLGAQGCTTANCVFTDGMIILMR